ncbi:hypothetical protein KI688_005835 [Linnemannia hyalina]|uniref:HCP-like protein n=1 Tax=Linnemannia hyalina TaxID=64524 RepID=A0A9P8BZJ1_9FUNG|nr:hypothetical protein KI688_005835 [Linnemannia hyalina]
MLQDGSQTFQAVHPITKDSIDSPHPSTPGKPVFIDVQFDPVSHKPIVLWGDVVQAFEDALHIRYNSRVVPFLKGADLNPLVPHRIAAMPEVVLDIVVRGNPVRTETASPQEKVPGTSPMSYQEQTGKTDNSIINTTSVIRRNPVYGLENAAMENYTHIDRPPTVSPSARAPQSLSTTTTLTSDVTPQPQPMGNIIPSRAPQGTSATAGTDDLTQIMFSAGQGGAKAQVSLGDMYKDGRKVHQDYQAAMDWYSKAAEQGDADGQRQVGYFYHVGLGVSKDYIKAMEWYHKASDQGNAIAQCNIGVLYYRGSGVPQDFSKAMDWYLKSADQGYAPAQHNIGILYYKGDGVPQDYYQAMEWFIKAANKGYAAAQDYTGILYHNGEGVTKDINKAIEWYKKAARQGDAKAKGRLDRLKQRGHTIE